MSELEQLRQEAEQLKNQIRVSILIVIQFRTENVTISVDVLSIVKIT